MADLFDQWLAHREGRPVPPPPTVVIPRINVPPVAAVSTSSTAEAKGAKQSSAVGPVQAAAPAAAGPTTYRFKPRNATRRILGFVLIAWGLSTLLIAGWAWQDRSWVDLGLVLTFAALTGVTWAVRAGTPIATLTVTGGLLEVTYGGETVSFDLTAAHTAWQVVGTPGKRTWRVAFWRRNMTPYVIDATMVNPHEFTSVLSGYRQAPVAS